MALPSTKVYVSRDGPPWTEVTSHTRRVDGLSTQAGRSRTLGEWEAGTATVTFLNHTRALDPLNDNATFQLRAGDHVLIQTDTVTVFWGWVDTVDVEYMAGSNDGPFSTITIQASDALARLNRSKVSSIASNNSELSSDLVDDVLTQVAVLSSWTVSTPGLRYISNARYGSDISVLTLLQEITRTEGGNSRLFPIAQGAVWRPRNWVPGTVVDFGAASIPFHSIRVDLSDDDWSNWVTVTPEAHTDIFVSTSSVAVGTGSKTFTVAANLGVSANATVSIVSAGDPGDTMTGTVTSYSGTDLVCNITSSTGAGTDADWNITTVEPGTAQTASDQQSIDAFDSMVRGVTFTTLHNTRPEALAEAYILASERAWPDRRIASFTVELAALSSADRATVLALVIGDAATVSFDTGAGDPQTIKQTRFIDGISHVEPGDGSHRVTFTLGEVPTLNFTAVVKQNNATVASTATVARYISRDGWVSAHGLFSITAAGTNNTEVLVTPTSLPAPLTANDHVCGSFWCYDATGGTTIMSGVCVWNGTNIRFFVHTGVLGQTPAFALASGDALFFEMSYPHA